MQPSLPHFIAVNGALVFNALMMSSLFVVLVISAASSRFGKKTSQRSNALAKSRGSDRMRLWAPGSKTIFVLFSFAVLAAPLL